MIRESWGFADLVFSSLDRYLEMFSNHTLMPLFFIPDLDRYTFSVQPFSETSYQDVLYAIIKLASSHYS